MNGKYNNRINGKMNRINGYHLMYLEAQGRRITKIKDEVERSIKNPITGELENMVDENGQIGLASKSEISKYKKYQKLIEKGEDYYLLEEGAMNLKKQLKLR